MQQLDLNPGLIQTLHPELFHCIRAAELDWEQGGECPLVSRPQSIPPGRRAAGPALLEALEHVAWRGSFPAKWSRQPACSLPNLIPSHNKWSPGGPGMMGWGEMGSELLRDFNLRLLFPGLWNSCSTKWICADNHFCCIT